MSSEEAAKKNSVHAPVLSTGIDCLDSPELIDLMVKTGAGEFFAGFIPVEWSERFGWEIEMNRRTFGGSSQYTRLEELQDVIHTVHQAGCRINLALNGHDYGAERLDMVRDIVCTVDKLNPDAFIVADPALMVMLEKWGVDRPLHLSTGAACFNSETVRYFCERHNVRRVVIPRKFTLPEMGRLMDRLGDLDLEFEVMVIGYRCHFNDELCFSLHSGAGSNLCTEFVKAPKQISKRMPDNWKEIAEDAIESPIRQFEEGSPMDVFCSDMARDVPEVPRPEKVVELGTNSVVSATFYNNCGLCAIPELLRMGVQVLKVPARGASWQKVPYLRAVRTIADDPAADASTCQALINSAGFCDLPETCYYHLDNA